jgi:hypothetical protein
VRHFARGSNATLARRIQYTFVVRISLVASKKHKRCIVTHTVVRGVTQKKSLYPILEVYSVVGQGSSGSR